MVKIYTRKGDDGSTGLWYGGRVPKSSGRPEAYGSVDEAASALGLPRSLVIKRIAYRAARSGLITGVLLATARVAGETAPLLFTALSNQFFSLNLTKTMANLPVTINNFVQSPYAYWKQLAWSGALLITLTVLALNIGARIIGAERSAK